MSERSADVGADDALSVILEPEMPLEAAAALAERLRAAGSATPVHIDAAALTAPSTPFVLTLAAALRARLDGGAPIRVERPSTAFVDAFSDLGLYSDLMKMEFVG